MKYFIIHGTKGSPKSNWFGWLKGKLESKGHTVFVPQFPTPENQSLESWLKVFKEYEKEIDNETILIGHSLGPAFILSILENINIKIKGAVLVAGFLGLLNNEHFDNLNKSFTTKQFDWNKIRNSCEQFYVINSKDDPYVPFERGVELATNLKTQIIPMENAGHINEEFGFTKFEEIFEYLNKIKLKNKS